MKTSTVPVASESGGRQLGSNGIKLELFDTRSQHSQAIVKSKAVAFVARIDVDEIRVNKLLANLVALVDGVVIVVVVQRVRVRGGVLADQVAGAVNAGGHSLARLNGVLAVVGRSHLDAFEYELFKRPSTVHQQKLRSSFTAMTESAVRN